MRPMVEETLLARFHRPRLFSWEGIEKFLSANLNKGSFDKEVFSSWYWCCGTVSSSIEFLKKTTKDLQTNKLDKAALQPFA